MKLKTFIFQSIMPLLIIGASYSSAEEFALGNKKSPITIIEYGSLTCGYCIGFHRNIFPEIKRDYINTGKARFTYRHYPTGKEAQLGAVALECAGNQYYPLLDALFAAVDEWTEADNTYLALEEQAVKLGIDKSKFKTCFNNDAMMQRVVDEQLHARKTYGARGTPTFLINGEIYQGKRSAEDFIKILDSAAQ